MDYNKDKEDYIEAIAAGEDIERMLVSFDESYNLYVSSRRFLSFFDMDDKKEINIIDYIHPDDVEGFKAYVDGGYESKSAGEIIRVKKNKGYHTCLIIFNGYNNNEEGSMNIKFEIIDIMTAVDFYEKSINDVAKTRLVLSLSDEILFTYNKSDNMFCLFKYDELRRVDLYTGDLDSWKKKAIAGDMVTGEDAAMFDTFILDLKSYLADFTVKFTSSVFTGGKTTDTRVMIGALYTDNNGEKNIVGRVIKDSKNSSIVSDELAGELRIDSLTDVYNKRTITEYAKKKLVEEKDNKVIIAILDLDHFKSVNDSFGHMIGDKVLARAGRRLKEIVGNDGVVGRIGGDEFMIVFTGLNDDLALRSMLRAIRTQIKWEFAEDFEGLSITCSIGASIYPTNGTDYDDLFNKADCCLYIAKEKGRDRYVFFRDELHRAEYEATLNGSEMKAFNSNREVRELQYVSKFMQMAMNDPQGAVKDALMHLVNNFGIDNVSVYYGDKYKKIFSYGVDIEGINDGKFIGWKEYSKLMADNANCVDMGFVSHYRSSYPKLCRFFKESKISSTIQCAIIDGDVIKGAVTFNKNKGTESQWANYEVDCASVFASYIGVMCKNGHQSILENAEYNTSLK